MMEALITASSLKSFRLIMNVAVAQDDLDRFVQSVLANYNKNHVGRNMEHNRETIDKENTFKGKIDIKFEDNKITLRNRMWNFMNNKYMNENYKKFHYINTNFTPHNRLDTGMFDKLPFFNEATKIKCDPDFAYLPLRLKIVTQNKELFIPNSRNHNSILYSISVPVHFKNDKSYASYLVSSKGMREFGKPVHQSELPKLQVLVVAAVGVDLCGNQIGKGGSFSDMEYCVLREYGVITDDTVVVSFVDDNQIYKGIIPSTKMNEHDIVIDVIVTPTQIIRTTPNRKKPTGIIWNKISRRQYRRIYLLRKLRLEHHNNDRNVSLCDEIDYDK
ncbi:hypothetical protein SNEBB_007778 [Seison nebaliae]|nr:hypothetical protein SNEBB_007778 [Seison nebaliae]